MHQKLTALRADLNQQFPERREVIDGSLAAVLAGEHVLLLGPPGTAKSALVRALAQAFGGTYFERLLTKFSTPEELFGPISIRALEQDRFARVTAGKLPEAEFAFVDEVFKASSAALNTLLTILNERVFHNDGPPVPVPLVSLFGASNELPEGKEVEALWDRFLVRFQVDYLLRPSSLKAVFSAGDPTVSSRLDLKTLRAMQGQVAKVKVTDATVDALIAIRDALKAEGHRRVRPTLEEVAPAHAGGRLPRGSGRDLSGGPVGAGRRPVAGTEGALEDCARHWSPRGPGVLPGRGGARCSPGDGGEGLVAQGRRQEAVRRPGGPGAGGTAGAEGQTR